MAYNKPDKRNSNQKPVATYSQTAIQVKSQLLPDPHVLEMYEKMIPNVGERLLSLSEKEQLHRHKTENNNHKRVVLGQWFAMMSILVIGGVCVYCLYRGYPNQAVAIATGALVTIVLAFLGLKFSKSASQNKESQKF